MSLSIGHDIEFVVRDSLTKQPLPVVGKVGGTKDRPVSVNDLVGTTYQEDGMCIEFGMSPIVVDDASVGTRMFFENLQAALCLLPTLNPSIELHDSATIEVDPFVIEPVALMIGCDPDKDAYIKGRRRNRPDPWAFDIMGRGVTRRFAGGHLHFGYQKTGVPKWAAINLLDMYALLFSKGLEEAVSEDHSLPTRYKFYGRPGLFRDKPYGIEYRSPSNYWGRTQDHSFVEDCLTVMLAIDGASVSKVKEWHAALPTAEFKKFFVDDLSNVSLSTVTQFRSGYAKKLMDAAASVGITALSGASTYTEKEVCKSVA